MTKFTALIIWPFVYILDMLSWLLGFQTFKQARDTSNKLFKQLMAQDKGFFESGESINSAIFTDN